MTSSPSDPHRQKANELLARWHRYPALFFREALGVTPWSKQIEMAEAIRTHRRVAVKSGQKVGKSALVAWVAIWWLFTRANAKVVLTAPSEHQVKNIIWPEVRGALGMMRRRPPVRLIEPTWCALDPRTGLRLPDGRALFCVTTDSPERMQGLSGANLLFCVDEGSGYPPDLWAPILGNLAGGGRVLTTGNPTQTSGEFYDAFTSASAFWHGMTISSWETPNAVADREVIPGLALRSHCEEMRAKWGEESIDYQVRILGEFPMQSSSSVIALKYVDAAFARWEGAKKPYGRLDIGVDVARFGDDDSVIALRRDVTAWIEKRINGMDGSKLAGEIAAILKAHRAPGERVAIRIDEIGVGTSVLDALRLANERGDLGPAVLITGINVQAVADDEDEYHALRDQLWFGVALFLKEGGAVQPDAMLKADLLAPEYGFDERGRRRVEKKDVTKKRLRRSPDSADALCLAVYSGRSGRIEPVSTNELEAFSRWDGVEGRGF